MKIEDPQRRVRNLKQSKGFGISPQQRLACMTAEVGRSPTRCSDGVLKLSRAGNGAVGKMSAAEVAAVKENPGMEIYDVVWKLLGPADTAGVDPGEAFARKAGLNENRGW